MLDYYGSITMQSDEVKKDLLSAFTRVHPGPGAQVGPYETDYIEGLIEDLGILDVDYSVSGWSVFHFDGCCKLIRDRIQRDVHAADQAKKRLA